MGLRIIYGKSGTGKTTFCLNEIKNKINEEKKLLFITPEQFSFNAEKNLIEILGTNASINAEVITFRRMAYRVFNEEGLNKKVTLTKSAKSMLIYNLIQKQKENLKFLGKANSLEGNTQIILNTITELKRHGVDINHLKQANLDIKDKYLKTKILEILLIYENYQNYIQENYIDTDDELTLLYKNLEKTNLFKDCIIWIDEFTGFTKQEYLIIEKLLNVCKQVNISICTDSLILDESIKNSDIYYTSKKTIEKLIKIANENNIKIDKPIYLKQNYRFKCDELKHIEENLFSSRYNLYDEECNNISLFIAQDLYEEVENVAKQIINLVKNEGLQFRDISVITKDAQSYNNLISSIFKEYNIPVFIDIEADLSSNILIKYVLSVFDIILKNWSYESVFNYLKTGLVDVEKDDINYLENYVLKWGIKGSKWYKEDWQYGLASDVKNDGIKEELKKVNDIRRNIIQPIIKLKEKILSKKSVLEITKNIYEFLQEQKIYEKLDHKITYLKQIGNLQMANEYTLTWNILMNIFDEIVLILGNQIVSLEEYKNTLKFGIMQNKITTIPSTLDQILVGDIDRTRSSKVKVTFIIGVIDGIFPTANNSEGFIDDTDRQKLKDVGIEMAKDTKELMYEDEYNIYKAFTSAEEKIFLSLPSSDMEGKTLRHSSIITKLKKIFIKLYEESYITKSNFEIKKLTTQEATFKEMLNNIRQHIDNNEIDNNWFLIMAWYNKNKLWREKLQRALRAINNTYKPENIDKSKILKLYGNNIKTSISKLESYKACAFSYHLKYGLRVMPREEFTIENIDIGTFMHTVIDLFFEYIDEENIKISDITLEECKTKVEEIINQVLKTKKGYMFASNAKYIALSMKLKKVVSKALWMIISELQNSNFNVIGHEIEFGKDEKFPPIIIKLPEGQEVELTRKN